MKLFEEGDLRLPIDDEINNLILLQAGDTAEKLTELECRLHNTPCYVTVMEGDTEVSSYTDIAQDIFNIYYDEQVTELYNLLNAQLIAIKNN